MLFSFFCPATLVAQMVKNRPAMQETWVQFLVWEDPSEDSMATHSSILAWRIQWTEEPSGLPSMGSQRISHNWASKSIFYIFSKLLVHYHFILSYWTIQFSSVAQLCLTLCNPMDCSTPGFPVHQNLPEFTQTHIRRVGDVLQPSHILSSPFLCAPNPSQHQ